MPIAIYLRRWKIENLFQCLKSRGFSSEETHMTEGHRVAKLMVLLGHIKLGNGKHYKNLSVGKSFIK